MLWTALAMALLPLSSGLIRSTEVAADCAPYVHWLSQGVSPGETVMVVGWCFGPQPSVEFDGNITVLPLRTNSGGDAKVSAIMAVLPLRLPPGRHTVAVRTSDGRVSNTQALNDACLWWAQGDAGPAATAGGWIRAFGRELAARTGSDGTHTEKSLVAIPLILQ